MYIFFYLAITFEVSWLASSIAIAQTVNRYAEDKSFGAKLKTKAVPFKATFRDDEGAS